MAVNDVLLANRELLLLAESAAENLKIFVLTQ